MNPRLIRVLVAALLLTPSGALRADELTAAQMRKQQVQEQLQAAVDELHALQTRTAEFEARRDELARQLSLLQTHLSDSQVRLDDRVRRLYVRGDTSPVVMLFAAESPTAAMERAAIAARLIRDDRATIQQVSAQRRQVAAVNTRLGQQQQALDEAFRRQQEVSTELRRSLEEAASTVEELEEDQRREEEARRLEEQRRHEEQRRLDEQRRREETEQRRMAEEQRQRMQAGQRQLEKAVRAQPPPVARPQPPPIPPRSTPRPGRTPGTRYVCPVVEPRSFSDTWGAPRSGGRRHQGTDIFAPYGAKVVAIVNGVIDLRGYGTSAGWWLTLRGDDGTSYWYLHLQRYAIADGARVSVGQLIGHNGDTGNAKGTPPHVHFEQHPGGGAAANPYPRLKRTCG